MPLVSVRHGVLQQWYPLIDGRSQQERANGRAGHAPQSGLRLVGRPLSFYPTLRCPLCGAILPSRQFTAKGFMICPSCDGKIRVPRWRNKLVVRGGFVCTIVVSFLLGFRGAHLLAAILLGFLPMVILWAGLLRIIFPMKLEPCTPRDQAASTFK